MLNIVVIFLIIKDISFNANDIKFSYFPFRYFRTCNKQNNAIGFIGANATIN